MPQILQKQSHASVSNDATDTTCSQCNQLFEVSDVDYAYYNKISPIFHGKKYAIPSPTLCPDCRMQRRMTHRAERVFYSRSCDSCKKQVISFHQEDASFPVYCLDCWWSDSWDAMEYGRDFLFDQTFFDQFLHLRSSVPTVSIIVSQGENSDYSNYCSRVRNCYLLIAGDQAEDCMYGSYAWLSQNCIDCMNVIECERCYDSTECQGCYDLIRSQKCENSTECILGYDLRGCSNCVGCVGLRNKEYHWFNKPLSREEYEKRLADNPLTHETLNKWWNERELLKASHPHKYAQLVQCEGCTGDSLSQSKNAQQCFDSFGLEDCKYIVNGPDEVKDCMDFTGVTGTEISYEGVSVQGGNRVLFSKHCWQGCSNIYYCDFCMGCTDCFGCFGLVKKQYCILNKQYTKEEYETLVPKIIEHMKKHSEWGEFFPVHLSPFAYNETLAQEYYPLLKGEVEERGWRWMENKNTGTYDTRLISAQDLPERIEDTPDDILNWAIECERSKKPFKIVKQELAFYRMSGIPIPRLHPDERHRDRLALRNPRKLWHRNCMKCNKKIETTYSPSRPEQIYCEECYLKEVY